MSSITMIRQIRAVIPKNNSNSGISNESLDIILSTVTTPAANPSVIHRDFTLTVAPMSLDVNKHLDINDIINPSQNHFKE